MEISKGDWKLFRSKLPEWQEAYMDRLNKEYIQLLSEDAAASDKFWRLEKRIREDKRRAGVLLEVRRSAMLSGIMRLIDEGAIRQDDLNDFSKELQDAVRTHIEINESFLRRLELDFPPEDGGE